MYTSKGSICVPRAALAAGALLLGAWVCGCSTPGARRAAPDVQPVASNQARALQPGPSIAAVAPAPGEVVVSALLVSPGAVDADGDGAADPIGDEYIELTSRLSVPIDLAGAVLRDATRARYVFPAGAYLPPGGALVIFGSDAPLSLDDEGDRVRLVSASGVTLHEVGYTSADVVTGRSLSNLPSTGPSPTPALTTSDVLGHDRVPGAFISNSPGTMAEGLPCRQVRSHAWSCPLSFGGRPHLSLHAARGEACARRRANGDFLSDAAGYSVQYIRTPPAPRFWPAALAGSGSCSVASHFLLA